MEPASTNTCQGTIRYHIPYCKTAGKQPSAAVHANLLQSASNRVKHYSPHLRRVSVNSAIYSLALILAPCISRKHSNQMHVLNSPDGLLLGSLSFPAKAMKKVATRGTWPDTPPTFPPACHQHFAYIAYKFLFSETMGWHTKCSRTNHSTACAPQNSAGSQVAMIGCATLSHTHALTAACTAGAPHVQSTRAQTAHSPQARRACSFSTGATTGSVLRRYGRTDGSGANLYDGVSRLNVL
jgi:hypothetical protein